jgi:hypothetical protein
MKTFSRISAVGVAMLAGVGLCLDQAAAQTNAPAPQGGSPTHMEGNGYVLFTFEGGNPIDFVRQAQAQCKNDWEDVATIPREMLLVQVPKIRLRVNLSNPQELLELYNRLGEQNPSLGKWVWEGQAKAPIVLMLAPSSKTTTATNAPAAAKEPEMEVKVFLLTYISGTNLNTAAEAVKAIYDVEAQAEKAKGLTPLPYHVVVDERTASLIVTGPQGFVDGAGQVLQTLDMPSKPPNTTNSSNATGHARPGGGQ